MMKIDVLNREGTSVGEIELNDAIFAVPVNVPVMHQAVRVYLNSLRRGNASTKNRSAVSGGGKKPWRQKGTGRSSFGSSRNPVWRGGGVAFGPTPRSYSITMPKKMRRLALLSALSSKAAEGNLVVVDELDFAAPKTKEMARVLANLNASNALIVLAEGQDNTVLAARNLVGVNTAAFNSLNTYKVLYNEKLVITKQALAALEEVLA
ncbi:MAG: 50S ribosomal protein L4 [Firmicutes bacterium]|nr:50S ribosomal protein L4 [Bacillota bacterium]MBR6824741.1 50S ribosomal protein L4 [Bacillota bacterium]